MLKLNGVLILNLFLLAAAGCAEASYRYSRIYTYSYSYFSIGIGSIVGIVIGCLFFVGGGIALLVFCCCIRNRQSRMAAQRGQVPMTVGQVVANPTGQQQSGHPPPVNTVSGAAYPKQDGNPQSPAPPPYPAYNNLGAGYAEPWGQQPPPLTQANNGYPPMNGPPETQQPPQQQQPPPYPAADQRF